MASKKCLEDFEQYVKNDSIKQLPIDGTIHELTSTVCIYLKRLFEYKEILDKLWENNALSKQSILGDFTCFFN